MPINLSSVAHLLSTPTKFFGLKLWIIILTCIGFLIIIIILIVIPLYCCRSRKNINKNGGLACSSRMTDRRLLSRRGSEIQSRDFISPEVYSGRRSWVGSGGYVVDMEPAVGGGGGGAGRCWNYSAKEVHLATDGFNEGYRMGSGDDGEVYRGILMDGKRVVVKKFISKSENVSEFIEEVEAIWCLRHKNLVKLLGYSIEGSKRMLVYDYIDNSNLHQWLHGRPTRISPLTWSIRMRIILGITKGLVYLHEDSEPHVVHQHFKSSSILLDHQWNPKITDIGVTKLLHPELTHTLRRMSGYIAPEYYFTSKFNEKSDIYSFGVLTMEIITGRMPVEFAEFGKKEYLVEWVKSKVSNQELDDIMDPYLPEPPSSKELKRILLIALRCVDPEFEKRPTIGDVIHMLEPHDLLLDDVSHPSFTLPETRHPRLSMQH